MKYGRFKFDAVKYGPRFLSRQNREVVPRNKGQMATF